MFSNIGAHSVLINLSFGSMVWHGPEVIKLFSCSTQQSIKFVLLINLKILTIPNSFLLNIAEHEIFSANNKYENASSAEMSMKKVL